MEGPHKGIGDVNSCTHYPASDIEVILPNKRESIILTEQYKHTLNLPLKIIESAKQVTNPLGGNRYRNNQHRVLLV